MILIKKGPGHKSILNNNFINNFVKWLQTNHSKGMIAKPYDFRNDNWIKINCDNDLINLKK